MGFRRQGAHKWREIVESRIIDDAATVTACRRRRRGTSFPSHVERISARRFRGMADAMSAAQNSVDSIILTALSSLASAPAKHQKPGRDAVDDAMHARAGAEHSLYWPRQRRRHAEARTVVERQHFRAFSTSSARHQPFNFEAL